MSKQYKNCKIRLILGYNCRLQYDAAGECYLISCDKFPGVLEDGLDAKQATVRMRYTLSRHIREMKKRGEPVPPMDNPNWEKVMAFTGHFPDDREEKNEKK